jgi:hypothetical protein
MASDRIRRAMNAGRRWARRQLKDGIEITPSATEKAAQESFQHKGLQHLFIIAALEVLFEGESAAGPAIGTAHKPAA